MARTLADMTPEEARQWLEEISDDLGGIRYIRDEMRVPLETLAAERLEYGVTAVIGGRRLIMSNTSHGNSMDGMGRWFPMKELAEDFMRTVTAPEPRLVCRRASTYWEATDE